MNEITVGIVGLGVLLLIFSTGIELGFGMALVGFVGFSYLNGFQAGMNLIWGGPCILVVMRFREEAQK